MNKRNGHKQIEHYEATTDYLIFPILYSLVKSRRLNKNAESFPSLCPKMLTPCFKKPLSVETRLTTNEFGIRSVLLKRGQP